MPPKYKEFVIIVNTISIIKGSKDIYLKCINIQKYSVTWLLLILPLIFALTLK